MDGFVFFFDFIEAVLCATSALGLPKRPNVDELCGRKTSRLRLVEKDT